MLEEREENISDASVSGKQIERISHSTMGKAVKKWERNEFLLPGFMVAFIIVVSMSLTKNSI